MGFYHHMGFEVIGRSPLDNEGKPFPILHMRLREVVKGGDQPESPVSGGD